MEHDVVPFEKMQHERGVANIAAHHAHGLPHGRVQLVEPAIAVEGIVLGERRHLGTRREQRLGQVRADKAIGPGHGDTAAAIVGVQVHGMSRQSEIAAHYRAWPAPAVRGTARPARCLPVREGNTF